MDSTSDGLHGDQLDDVVANLGMIERINSASHHWRLRKLLVAIETKEINTTPFKDLTQHLP